MRRRSGSLISGMPSEHLSDETLMVLRRVRRDTVDSAPPPPRMRREAGELLTLDACSRACRPSDRSRGRCDGPRGRRCARGRLHWSRGRSQGVAPRRSWFSDPPFAPRWWPSVGEHRRPGRSVRDARRRPPYTRPVPSNSRPGAAATNKAAAARQRADPTQPRPVPMLLRYISCGLLSLAGGAAWRFTLSPNAVGIVTAFAGIFFLLLGFLVGGIFWYAHDLRVRKRDAGADARRAARLLVRRVRDDAVRGARVHRRDLAALTADRGALKVERRARSSAVS